MTGLTVRHWGGRYYAICRGDKLVRGPYSSWLAAMAALDRMERAGRVTIRACMCCGARFKSEGPHHRLCNRCRRQDG
jgi:hypothetical protein